MSGRIERTARLVDLERAPRERPMPVHPRTHGERLADALELHREGNTLFKGGHPPFAFVWRFRDVDAR